MRWSLPAVLAAVMLLCPGCRRPHNLSDFPFSSTLTLDDLEEKVGSPDFIAYSGLWASYRLNDGSQLRVYFLNGPRNGPRRLSEADLYSASGIFIQHCFQQMETTTQPTTQSQTAPASTEPAEPTALPVSAVPASAPASSAATRP